jgi:hypothetical protein
VSITATAAPQPPTIGAATRGAVGNPLTASIAWTAPANNGGSAITAYRITTLQCAGNGLNCNAVGGIRTVGPAVRTSTFTLAAGTYRFAVAAVNVVGQSAFSANSNAIAPR